MQTSFLSATFLCVISLVWSKPSIAATQLEFSFRLGLSSFRFQQTAETIELEREPRLEAFRLSRRPCFSQDFDELSELIAKRLRLRTPGQVVTDHAQRAPERDAILFKMAGRSELIHRRTTFAGFLDQLPGIIEAAELKMRIQCRDVN
jgi:hypothetical protein